MIDIQLIGLLNATLQAATLLFIAALGELITEKSGILNLGVEGMISVGAVTGFMTAINTENIFLAVSWCVVFLYLCINTCTCYCCFKTRPNSLRIDSYNFRFSPLIITWKK